MQPDNRRTESQSEDGRYRLLIEAITDYAIYMLDADGIVSSWNPGARRFKGYEPREIIGRHFSTFYTVEDRAAGVPERALQTAANEGQFEAEGWRVRKDGTQFWAHVVIDPIRGADGRIIGYSKVTRDLTERRAAEEELRRSEEQFRLLVQGVTDYAIYMLDPNGIVTNWNAGAQRIKGYAPSEIIGRHFSAFYTDEDRRSGLPERALKIASSKGRFESEGRRVRKDGTVFLANVVIDAIRSPQGTLLGFAKITRDVTDKDLAQRELDRAREALFQSQKMDAVGQLTGGVAHDFNNLLAAILGSLTLVQKRMNPDPKVGPLLDNAIKAAERGAALTKRMLAFARKQELKPISVDFIELTHGMTEMLSRSLGPMIVIDVHFPTELPPVLVDPNQLELALLNLAVNARDAMPEGGTLSISGRPETLASSDRGGLAPGDYVVVSVADSGEGMDAETLARAAEPFFTTKGVGKGTGLGLSMVHGLVEQSGGLLRLTSKIGSGTTAEMWLPTAANAEPARVTAPQKDKGPLRQLTVLAVDDDALVLMNTTVMLEELGHKVVEASSGQRALDILKRENSIDLVVSDQAMPGMTGAQLIDLARADRPGLPVVLATGYSELPPGIGENIPRLSKPFGERDLADAIAKAISPAG